MMSDAPSGQGAPWFVPFELNLFTDTPPWDDPGVVVYDDTGSDNPLIGPVASADNYSGFIGMALTIGPVGDFQYDDVFYFELDFAAAPLSIECDSPPAGKVGQFYSHAFPAAGGTPPRTFSISAGVLPSGLALLAPTGVVEGIPTRAGRFTFTVRVTDADEAFEEVECSISICPLNAQGV